MSGHTPGPWVADEPGMGFSSIRQKATGRLVFALAHPSTSHGDDEIPDDEKYANLALFVAAPDLLVALKEVLAKGGTSKGEWVPINTYRAAEAAIKKAEGR